MPVLREVLAWSRTAPEWQRDALRRIVRNRSLSEDDITELVGLCKRPHGLSEADVVAEPLSPDDVPVQDQQAPVVLKAVKHVRDVNALEPGQEVVFGVSGLTVVYGDNGAGKSSYARILKRACRARGAGEPVLPNALAETPGGTPTAEMTFAVGADEKKLVWRDGEASSFELGSVSVFDAASAQVYVASKTEVAFRPFGLDVMDRLAAACATVKARLEKEQSALQREIAAWPTVPVGSAAAKFLASLSALTPAQEVERVASLTAEEEEKLKGLIAVLSAAKLDDPLKRSGELKMRAGRVTKLVEHVRTVSRALGADAVRQLDWA